MFLLIAVFLFVLALPAYSTTQYTTFSLTGSAGEPIVVVHDELAGVVTVAKGQSNSSVPEYIYVPVRRFGFTDGSLIRAGDFNGDGLLDLVLPAYSSNRVLVLWGADLARSQVSVDMFSAGPGPAFAVPARRERGAAESVLVTNTARTNVQVQGWDLSSGEPVAATTADYPDGFGQEGIFGFETAASSRGAPDPVLGILRKDPEAAEFVVLKIVQRLPDPEYGPNNAIASLAASAAHTRLISGHPAGGHEPGWFLGYAPGASVIELFPSSPGDSFVADLGSPAAQIWFLPDVADEVLVLFENGTLAQFDFSAATGLSLAQILVPPPGMTFAGAAGGGGNLVALLADGFGQLAQYQVYEKGAQGYGLVAQSDWPALPMMDGAVTVVLYTGDPFATPPPFAFETFVAGNWATGVSFDQGTVSAFVESFGGPAQGLENPVLEFLQPEADPGPGGAALGNQWEPSSSLFHLASAAAADGAAPVIIQPPPGGYSNTIVVSFQAGEDVTVIYRINEGPWQSGFGPFLLTQSATVEYYGEHISGALSSIQTAHYQIQQSLVVDSDGDGVPDIIEEMVGTNPFNPDSSGSGWGDFNWILYGDLDNPDEAPAHIALPFDRFNAEVAWDDADSVAIPSLNQKLSIANALNQPLGSAAATSNPGRAKYDNIVLKRGTTHDSAFSKFWFPANYLLEGERVGEPVGPAMVAFGGIPPAPLPSIPVDLDADDPLEAWRQAALAAVEEHENTVLEFTIGPASTIAALIFEYWYGARLVELGRLPSVDERPRLADTPLSVRAGQVAREDFEAIQSPRGADLLAHELAHVVQQVNGAILTGENFAALRETAESFYAQAIDARRDGAPLDPPLNALRQAISGSAPDGYLLPHGVGTLTALRDQVIGGIAPRGLIAVTGILSQTGDDLFLDSGADVYRLVNRDGRPYRFTAAGLAVEGSIARAIGEPLASNEVGIETLELALESIVLESVPAEPITDINGNGLPDQWELAFVGSLAHDIWDDLNGDGFVLGEAYLAGTDPRDPFWSPPGAPAIPRNLRITPDAGGGPRVEWDGSFVAEYELWNSEDLANWTRHPGAIERRGDRHHAVEVDFEDPRAFYRLHIRLPLQ